MSNLFSLKNVKNKPHRDGFDLSFNNLFTAPLGALLPVMYKDVMPGDKFDINLSWFTRSQPATAPAYSRFTEMCDFFFVPYHFMWRYFPDFITQTNSNNWATSIAANPDTVYTQLPYISQATFKNALNTFNSSVCPKYDGTGGYNNIIDSGFNIFHSQCRLFDIDRLLRYLNIGSLNVKDNTNTSSGQSVYTILPSLTTGERACNIFPLLAYNKIYQDFYRNQQWEKPSPNTYNLDYITPLSASMEIPLTYNMFGTSARLESMFDLKYANYNKDYFTGVLPSKQFGNTALASPLLSANGEPLPLLLLQQDNERRAFVPGALEPKYPEGGNINNVLQYTNFNTVGISALAIRQAEFLQKWKEITQSGGQNYVDQIQKHFGVTPSRDIAHQCKYLGGVTKNFGADEVVNTNLIGNNQATLAGKMVNTANGHLEFSAKEHGILMAIYHVGLLPSYERYCPKYNTKVTATDFVMPEMDNIGMQPVYEYELGGITRDFIRGYVPRYSEYKTSVDEIHGAFVETYRNWVTPVTDNVYGEFSWRGTTYTVPNYVKLKQSPNVLDNLFQVQYDGKPSTDQFFVNMDFNVKAVRNISRDGLPY